MKTHEKMLNRVKPGLHIHSHWAYLGMGTPGAATKWSSKNGYNRVTLCGNGIGRSFLLLRW